MKRNIILLLILLPFYTNGQNNNTDCSDIHLDDFLPSDYDAFWSHMDACGRAVLSGTHTQMDTFIFFYRQPFSQYLLGDYYYGYILNIDSVTTESIFMENTYDSVIYVYAVFNVIEQYSSPYNKEIYSSPIPSDIKNDSKGDFGYFKSLQKETLESYQGKQNVCIMMTKQELEKNFSDISNIPSKDILLNVTLDTEQDSANIIFCSQPFFEEYSTSLLLTKRQIAKYKLFVYKQIYREIYKTDLPITLDPSQQIYAPTQDSIRIGNPY